MINIESLTQSDRLMDALTERVARCLWLITRMRAHIMRHVEQIEEEYRLAQRLQQQIFETTYRPLFATAMVEAGVVTPTTCTQSKTDSDGESRQRPKRLTERHNQSVPSTSSTWIEGDEHCKRNSGSRKVPVLEEPRVSSSESEAGTEHKSRDSSKDSRMSKKPKMVRPVNDMFSTALDFNSYHWLTDHL